MVLLACTPQAHADLIVNGGFENGPNPNAFTQLDVGSTAVTGWVVTRDAIDYCGTIWPAAEGVRSIDLAPSGVNGAGGHRRDPAEERPQTAQPALPRGAGLGGDEVPGKRPQSPTSHRAARTSSSRR
jgi:hypothetical protein